MIYEQLYYKNIKNLIKHDRNVSYHGCRRKQYTFRNSNSKRTFPPSAVILSKDEFLCFQVSFCKSEPLSAVFSGPKTNITKADFNWIFEKCAKAVPGKADIPTNLFENGRCVYAFSMIPENIKRYSTRAKQRNTLDECEELSPSNAYFQDLFKMLKSEKGILRFIANGASESTQRHGMILLSIRREMSLRLQTAFSFAFPFLTCKKISDSSEKKSDIPSTPDIIFVNSMADILLNVVSAKREKSKKTSSAETDFFRQDFQESDLEDEELPFKDTKVNFMESLNDLVGLSEVKEQVRKIASFAKMKKELGEYKSSKLGMSLNMEFVGNPGTAKTTVARICAGIFHEAGLLPSDELIEVGRADLVAKYVGQTAQRVKMIFRAAKGKTLFIDEAYSLIDFSDNSFGDEAINTIVQEIENLKGETVVIFAGYPEKMSDFFQKNPGLRSRVPFTLRFNDYSPEEMMQIMEKEVEKRGFTNSDSARAKAMELCIKASKNPDAGNGRFCRNLVENAILSYAERVYGDDGSDEKQNLELIPEDYSALTSLSEDSFKTRFGFNS